MLSKINGKQSASKIFFPNLDGLRSIAFLMVFFQHGMWNSIQNLNIHGTIPEKIIHVLCDGGIGVSIFFVLSGFLITYLLLNESALNGKINIGHFYIRRTLRIWPLYFSVIIFAFIIYPYMKSLSGVSSLLEHRPLFYFFFLSNFDVIHVQTFFRGAESMCGSITWSVAIEEQFYLVWPVLFLVVPKRYYPLIFFIVVFISLVFRCVFVNDPVVLYFHSLAVCADLALGGFCAYCVIYYEGFRRTFLHLRKITILAIYFLALVWFFWMKNVLEWVYAPVMTRFIGTLFFAFVILEQNYSKNSIFKLSQSRFLSTLGKYTYGLYLLHPVALLSVYIVLRKLHVAYETSFVAGITAGIAALALSIALSYLSYQYFELKFLRLKDGFGFTRHAISLPSAKVAV